MPQPCAHCQHVHPSHVSVCPITGERISPLTLVNEDEILVGSVVGERYHVRDVIGQGTTGTVFAIEHIAFPRAAAMKVLRPRYAPLETVLRVFHGEARTAFTVTHACLPEIFDMGQMPDGAPYFTMERLHGETLARRMRRERLSLAAAVDVMMQILSAVEAIHARDLLLCDLRPQNVYLSHRRGCRPVVKILDFGLARMVPLERVQEEWESLRSVEDAEGDAGSVSIPYYLSPERTRGGHESDMASDLFVVATIFYEMLTGERPFRASSYDGLLLEVAQAQARSLGELRPDISEDLAALVMRALASSPRARPASAREFQDELRAIFEGARRGNARVASASMATPMSMPVSATRPNEESGEHQSTERMLERGASTTTRQSLPSLSVTAEAPAPAVSGRVPSAAEPLDPIYEEERTQAERRYAELHELMATGRCDEASADSPTRTVPPPAADASIPVDVDVDLGALNDDTSTATSGGDDVDAAIAAVCKLPDDELETETMRLAPELRARMRGMGRTGASSLPPPAKPSR